MASVRSMHGGTVASQRSDGFRSAPFLPPQLPASVVDRPRLVDMFGIDSGASWTVVVGAPGSGKTTLMSAWTATRDESVTWIELTSGRHRRSGLAETIVRAVQAACPSDPLDAFDDIGNPDVTESDMLDHLVDELSQRPVPIILVVDDTHLLDADEWELMQRLVVQLPPTFHLVVGGRSEPPIPLGRERATGRLVSVRSGDLAFRTDEVARLLDLVTGTTPDATVQALRDATEGWAAGIRLAALAMRDGASPEVLLDGLAYRHETVAEFLVEEVLDHMALRRRDDLARWSLLELLEPDLCDAVTGRSDSAEVLRELAVDGSFVMPAETGRYRFHPLLAELLRHEFKRDDPQRACATHLAAAEWFVARDRPIASIEHFLAAGEHHRGHSLVLDFFRPLYVGTHRHDIDRWLAAIPDEVIAEDPERALDHCVSLALIGHNDAARWHRYCVERISPTDDWLTSRLDAIEALGLIVDGRLEAAKTRWQDSRHRRPSDRTEPIDEVLWSWDVRLEAMFGDPSRAVESARRLQQADREYVGDVPVLSVLAGALAAAGDHESARAVAASAIDMWRRLGEPALPGVLDAFVVAAAGAREVGDLDLADEFLDLALDVVPDWAPGPNVLTMIPLVERARVAHARGETTWRSQLLRLAEVMRTRGRPTELVDWVESARHDLSADDRMPTVSPTPPAAPLPGAERLTERETTVLGLLASHLSLPEIGTELFISPHTVKAHVKSIYRKLGVGSRSEAVSTARALRILA